jgi:hypothetical protein
MKKREERSREANEAAVFVFPLLEHSQCALAFFRPPVSSVLSLRLPPAFRSTIAAITPLRHARVEQKGEIDWGLVDCCRECSYSARLFALRWSPTAATSSASGSVVAIAGCSHLQPSTFGAEDSDSSEPSMKWVGTHGLGRSPTVMLACAAGGKLLLAKINMCLAIFYSASSQS